ncbi:hypothetical protein [Novosphingobium sp. PASSN1]|uniref:hypothetical protein n=1 Tax=Novosphingobium sp. PASSN1 TaxID=2015561 RepID=UPI000BDB0140|nr:hypothetical protein [Novosphingobium sp. PASSN1]OYU33185.1 MAG: hypothetical protein CFE35_21595 [Novosphingobium sp. PASSN1]
MELKFVAAQKPEAVDVTVQRRQRLVRRIDQQIALLQTAKDGMLPRTSWVWIDDKGTYLVQVRYGRHPLEFKKGMSAIQADSVEHAQAVFAEVRSMVLSGAFDREIEVASKAIRARFAKS